MIQKIIYSLFALLLTSNLIAQNSFPNGILVNKGTNNSTGTFAGSEANSAFHFSANEDTYIRGGKSTSNLFLGDAGAKTIIIGNTNSPTFLVGETEVQKTLIVRNGLLGIKGSNFGGSGQFSGSEVTTHFHFSEAEDTYIRGGKSTSRVIIGDIGASGLLIGNSASTTALNGTLTFSGTATAQNGFTSIKGNNTAGAALLRGSQWDTHFFFSDAEDTYIRGGKSSSRVIVGDVGASSLIVGNASSTTFMNGSIVVGSVPSTPAGFKLYVENGILTERVKVAIKTTANWSDYVFEKNYKLPSLENVEAFITKNKHLPGIPSANQVVAEGLDLGEMDSKLLGKVEELTLYMIELKKEIESLKKQINK
jgi:trimeric autotransporter adhesin